ncbi:MAG: hypothetical protein KME23_01090 [Goleter apudmare HA4340-LM2]|jgi:hypothetical protein|nr:hypothetical protein [Goleter apudmare HA4340-LM2]
MSVKWKLFLILILSSFATAGVYITQNQPSVTIFEDTSELPPQIQASQISQEIVAYPERSDYKTIPLSRINSTLQGSDPATLALNAFDEIALVRGPRKVEVVYPQRNQALVTITQVQQTNEPVDAIKYRVEMTTFGRSLLVSSPPVWQIIWAGSQVQCIPRSQPLRGIQNSKFKIQNEESPLRDCHSPSDN